ncbi:hypothetical protein ACLMAJ_12720 [Nocardia sp. KC 131]|uniref:hypothetical protein n=1 Tax=Nocardia arseniciresistens TaxID=3392119 RepID=UPI00398E75B1
MLVDPFQTQDLAAEIVLDERLGYACLQVLQEQFSFEEVAAVVATRADCEEGKAGMESYGVHGVARTEQGAAGQAIAVVHTDRRTTGLVCTGHCQQVLTLVVDGQGRITDLSEGTVLEDPVNFEHGGIVPGPPTVTSKAPPFPATRQPHGFRSMPTQRTHMPRGARS